MSPERTRLLYERYPALFRARREPPTAALLRFGFECGDGWFELVDRLCADLMALCRTHEIEVPVVSQVKEKLGELRVYLHGPVHPMLDERIAQAERASLAICERCAAAGRLGERIGYWCVRCERCAEEGWRPARGSAR
jgi:hypothetical protein